MNPETIESLREALKYSPENVPLRMLLAENLLALDRFTEAESEFLQLLKFTDDSKVKLGLANVYFQKSNYSACCVILEDEIQKQNQNASLHGLYAKALLKENQITKAMDAYKKAQSIDPSYVDAEMEERFKSRIAFTDSEDADESYGDDGYGEDFDPRFIEKPKTNFSDIGGMENVKKEIDLKIIKPLLHPELYQAYRKKIGGGILLYGPPGCGKTYIAKATAGQVNAKFINVSLNEILDMWIGNSEKNLNSIFELAREHSPCVVFIDEIDALGASRSDMKQSSSRHLINQFLQELDGVNTSNDGVLIIGATNAPWNLDAAFRRPGRFDRIIFVSPPDEISRESIFKLKLAGKPVGSMDFQTLAKKTENYSGADIDALIDIAVEEKLEKSFADGVPSPLETKDLLNALKKHKATTTEWFQTAKNYALFANESGLYDEILKYLKIKK
ncbi:adenosinetriphosphatase [Leptospira ryugenii]|uniref:Adenosinetriphosphatase n=1 Tax=Leptospira ryugenii TaxID=1917863 RepID=A0A2P2DV47_9LEPT|nr:ATP-binding protein [Leptospira ryugenii]GBF48521.1 adenosinetriphosphatase [Leptospira ryugenii]